VEKTTTTKELMSDKMIYVNMNKICGCIMSVMTDIKGLIFLSILLNERLLATCVDILVYSSTDWLI